MHPHHPHMLFVRPLAHQEEATHPQQWGYCLQEKKDAYYRMITATP